MPRFSVTTRWVSSNRRRWCRSRWSAPAKPWRRCATAGSTGARCCVCATIETGEGAMAKLTVSLAGVDYDRTRALFDGSVPIQGCETICCAMPPEEAFHRAFRYQEFDITELSLSNYMSQIARGTNGGGSPYVAIPAFPSRLF